MGIELPKKITREWLEEKVGGGNNNLMELAIEGRLGEIPKEVLTEELVCQGYTLLGNNALQFAIEQGKVKEIPKYLITEKTLFSRNALHTTSFYLLCSRGYFDIIPKEILKEHLFNKLPNERGTTPFHFLAQYGKIEGCFKEFLTLENLNIENENKGTPLLFAAAMGTLHKIPKRFITPEQILGWRGGTETDIPYRVVKKVIEHKEDSEFVFSTLPPSSCKKYLSSLLEIKKSRGEENPRPEGYNRFVEFVTKVELVKNIQEMGSLKI